VPPLCGAREHFVSALLGSSAALWGGLRVGCVRAAGVLVVCTPRSGASHLNVEKVVHSSPRIGLEKSISTYRQDGEVKGVPKPLHLPP
jgi:hypothetical protein